MNGSILEVIIIGAGHAGLSVSYYLKHLGLEHMMFERGRIAESWRSQRWDSLTMNTVNRVTTLPGSNHKIKMPENFALATEFVTSLESYASFFQLPVSENSNVVSVEKPPGSQHFIVTVSHENETPRSYYSWQVVIASGSLNEKKVPLFSRLISPDVKQIHSAEYRNVSQLPEGAVLVVGSGQSGCQIAEELLEAGRTVYLSTSQVPRIPRRYRGKDIMDWLIECRYFDLKTEDVKDPAVLKMREPLLSGIGDDGHTLSLQSLAGKGATLVGTLINASNEEVFFDVDTSQHIKFGDEFSTGVKEMINAHILKSQITVPPPDEDDADRPADPNEFIATVPSLNLTANNISTILWATGLKGSYDYIKLPVLDSDGQPKHVSGVTEVEGLFFVGCPWLRSRKSNLIYGIKDDAAFISDKVYSTLR